MTGQRRPQPIPLLIVSGDDRSSAQLAEAIKAHETYSGAIVLAHGTTPSAEQPMPVAECLCCAPGADIARLLEGLLRDHDNNRLPVFPALIVLVMATADPLPILATVLRHPYLSLRFAPARLLHLQQDGTPPPPADRVLGASDLRALLQSPEALAAVLNDPAPHPEPLRRALYARALGGR